MKPIEKYDLFIIEAPKKVDLVAQILSRVYGRSFQVVATSGRLYDLDPSILALDTETYDASAVIPLQPGRIRLIKDKSEHAEKVFILTDNDIEGEVIGRQVTTLLPSSKSPYRLRCNALIDSQLKASLESPGHINQEWVNAGTARRAFDRHIGFTFSDRRTNDYSSGAGGHIGRLLTPAIAQIIQNPPDCGFIERTVFSKESPGTWRIFIPFNHITKEKAAVLAHELSALEDPLISIERTSDASGQISPWDHASALRAISYKLDCPVSDTFDSLQHLYEQGKMNYARPDAKHISKESIARLHKLSMEFGVHDFDPDMIASKSLANLNYRVQGGHEALMPLTADVPLHLPLDDLSLNEQVLSLVAEHVINCGRRNYHSTLYEGRLEDNSHLMRMLLSKAPEMARKIKIFSIEKKGASISRTENSCLKESSVKEISKNTSIRCFRPDWVVLNILIKNGLGRPSTLSTHSHKIAKLFLDSNCRPNQNCLESFYSAQIKTPKLLDPAIAREIERQLLDGHSLSHYERISGALKIAGLLPTTGAGAPSSIPRGAST